MAVKSKVVKKDGGELVVRATVPAKDVRQLFDRACSIVAYKQGIRLNPGSAAHMQLEQKLGLSTAHELSRVEFMKLVAPYARSAANGVQTIGAPSFSGFDTLDMQSDFNFTVTWTILPEMELSSYDPVEITVPKIEITDAQVEEQARKALGSVPVYRKAEGTKELESGDCVDISLRLTKGGVEVNSMCFDSRPYTLGSQTMPPEFDKELMGMKPGETKTFSFESIDDIDDKGKPINAEFEATVTVNGLMSKSDPELTDEWVRVNIPNCDTADEFRQQVRAELEAANEKRLAQYKNFLSASALSKRLVGKIPDGAYAAMQLEVNENRQNEASRRGITIAELREQQGMDENQERMSDIMQIHDHVAQAIALNALARYLKMTVSEEDLDEYFEAISPSGQAKRLRSQFQQNGEMYLAHEGALRYKANVYLTEHATEK